MSKRKAVEEKAGRGSVPAAICAALALPEEVDVAIRYSDQYTCEPTAVVNPYREFKLNWSAQPAASWRQLAAEQMMIFLFRDALRHVIVYDPNPTNQTWSYQWYFADSSNLIQSYVTITGGSGLNLRPVYAKSLNAYSPHGTLLFPGRDLTASFNGYQFIWVDAPSGTATFTFSFSADPGNNATGITWYKWDDGNIRRVQNTPLVAGTVMYSVLSTPAGSGYYGFSVNTANTVNLTLSIAGVGSVWRHLSLPYIESNMDAITGLRLLGASLRWTNQASPLNQQGNIVSTQVGAGEDWTTFANGGYDLVSGYVDGKSRILAKGLDCFLKPMQESDFAMRVPFQLSDSGMCEAGFDLQNPSGFIVCAASCTLPAGCDTVVRVTSLAEFRSRNMWMPTAKPQFTTDDWIAALEIFKSLEQFYENPMHWKDILASIGKYARVATKYLAYIPHPYAQAASQVTRGVGALL